MKDAEISTGRPSKTPLNSVPRSVCSLLEGGHWVQGSNSYGERYLIPGNYTNAVIDKTSLVLALCPYMM